MIGEIPSQSLKMLINIRWNANQSKIEKEKKMRGIKMRRVLLFVIGLCFAICGTSVNININAADKAVIQVSDTQFIHGKNAKISVDIIDNTKNIAGIQLFVKYNTSIYSITDVESSLSEAWQVDWEEKVNTQYGDGILCMIQDTTLEGFSDKYKGIITLDVKDLNSTVGEKYGFELIVIDVCDKNGDSIKSYFGGSNKEYVCCLEPDISISEKVNIEGIQISSRNGGVRTVSSVEPEIDGKKVVEFGNIYAVSDFGVKEKELYKGSDNKYVASFQATQAGISDYQFSTSKTAINYVRTMYDNGQDSASLQRHYMVRAYAKLEDGKYVYSVVHTYSIYEAADILYRECKMNTYAGHEYLYENILKVVDKNYIQVDYNWGNVIAKP